MKPNEMQEVFELVNPYHGFDNYNPPLKTGRYIQVRTEPKINRNQSCPCGSGMKYKHCSCH